MSDLVVTTGVNSATMGPGPRRDALMASGDWREAHRLQERSIDAPAPTLDSKVGSAWQIHLPGQRGHGRKLTIQEAAALQTYPPTQLAVDDRRHDDITALDDFAGTGWGVACQWLGIQERGVEIMPEARATREANGMETIGADVWDHLAELLEHPWAYNLYIASPPCQTFSMAGNGAGRKALAEVLGLIDSKAYRDVELLREFGERHDPRTALVLVPLVRVYRDLPRYVVLEQVPTVLPVWERIAEEMRGWGYSVWVGKLYAEQYGVPQTRIRAVLIAKRDPDLDGEASPPLPTHSRYYSRNPQKLDPGVEKWVSMAEALGWDVEPGDLTVRTSMGEPRVGNRNGSHTLDPAERPMRTVTSKSDNTRISGDLESLTQERHRGAGMLERHGERRGRPVTDPALTITGNASGTTPGGIRVMRSNYGTGGDPADRGERTEDQPAPTMTSKADRNAWTLVANEKRKRSAGHKDGDGGGRAVDEPAPTITGGHDHDARVWRERPATTVAADDRIAGPGRSEFVKGGVSRQDREGSVKVTLEEAATLQSYPDEFDWYAPTPDKKGQLKPPAKGKQFLQVGNAVPPLLAYAVLKAVLA